MQRATEEKRVINSDPSVRPVNQIRPISPPLGGQYRRQLDPSSTKTVLSPPIGQFFINTLLQAAAFAAAIAFGVFAIKSVNRADTANNYAAKALEEARIANQIAMVVLCISQNGSVAAACAAVEADANIVFPSVASALFAYPPGAAISAALPTATGVGSGGSSITAPGSTSSVSIGTSAEVGIALGVMLFTCLAVFTGWRFLKRRSRRQERPQSVAMPSEAYDAPASAPGSEQATMPNESEGRADNASVRPKSRVARWWQVYRAVFLDSVVSTSEK